MKSPANRVRFNMLMEEELLEWAQGHVGKGRVSKYIHDLMKKDRQEVENKKRLERLLKKRRTDDGVPQV